jgi:hypothetical protein
MSLEPSSPVRSDHSPRVRPDHSYLVRSQSSFLVRPLPSSLASPQPSSTKPSSAWLTNGHEAQVFVDDSGRRALGVRLACVAAAALCAFWLTALVVGMVGFSGFAPHGPATLAQRIVTHRTTSRSPAPDLGETRNASIGRERARVTRASVTRGGIQAVANRSACTSYRAGARAFSARHRLALLRSACLVELAAAHEHRDVASA